jgi:hypothetical protein
MILQIPICRQQRVALTHVVERGLEGRAVTLGTRGLLLEQLRAADAMQRIELQGEVLLLVEIAAAT